VADAEAAGYRARGVAVLLAILVFFGGFYVLQLFTSVMIITLSAQQRSKLEEQEAEAEALREAIGLEPRSGARSVRPAGGQGRGV
jgi:hypothetical protein